MIEKKNLLRHTYIPMTHKNFILKDTLIMQIQCFLPRISTFYGFFLSETTSKLTVPTCFGQVGISLGK